MGVKPTLRTKLSSEPNWLIRLAGNLFLLRSKDEQAPLFLITGLSECKATNWSLIKLCFSLLFTIRVKTLGAPWPLRGWRTMVVSIVLLRNVVLGCPNTLSIHGPSILMWIAPFNFPTSCWKCGLPQEGDEIFWFDKNKKCRNVVVICHKRGMKLYGLKNAAKRPPIWGDWDTVNFDQRVGSV